MKPADRVLSMFRHARVVLPVLHVGTDEQALRNAQVARDAGADGVFLINHGVRWTKLLEIHEVVARAQPDWWIGVNCLDLGPSEVFEKISRKVSGVWVDDAGIREDRAVQATATAIARARAGSGSQALYFGGVAFKYQRAVEDVGRAARVAADYMDVVTTSGPGTGHAADVGKIQAMKAALGATPLAIASGITPENVGDYLPYVDVFLVATGISRSFEELDPAKVRALVEQVHAYRPPPPPTPEPTRSLPTGKGRWMQSEDALPSDWAQREVYGQPLFARSFREVAGRISQWNHEDAVVLRLFGRFEAEAQDIAALLQAAGLAVDATYSRWGTTATRPIEDGFLRVVRLRRDPRGEQVAAVPTIAAFVREELARFEREDVEAHLRRVYGELTEAQQTDPRFHYIDYPNFDSGSADVGFGVLLQRDIFVWSRVVHYHK